MSPQRWSSISPASGNRSARCDIGTASPLPSKSFSIMTMQSAPKSTNIATDRQHVVCRTNHVVLSDFTAARREATRPPEFRPENFERQFDCTTLFYDAVDIGDGQ